MRGVGHVEYECLCLWCSTRKLIDVLPDQPHLINHLSKRRRLVSGNESRSLGWLIRDVSAAEKGMAELKGEKTAVPYFFESLDENRIIHPR